LTGVNEILQADELVIKQMEEALRPRVLASRELYDSKDSRRRKRRPEKKKAELQQKVGEASPT
jgi:hypothetical protein